jgi:hypothetical protein
MAQIGSNRANSAPLRNQSRNFFPVSALGLLMRINKTTTPRDVLPQYHSTADSLA